MLDRVIEEKYLIREKAPRATRHSSLYVLEQQPFPSPFNTSRLRRRRYPIRDLWLNIRDGFQQVLDDLLPALVPRRPDGIQLLLGVPACILFGLLVAARVLGIVGISQ